MSRLVRLKPYARRSIWGGRRLGLELGVPVDPKLEPIGESLDASGLSAMPSAVEATGSPGLDAFFAAEKEKLMGARAADYQRFPLLVKRIDSRESLSVQVHPDDATALRLAGEPNGKSEAWVILDADPDAVIHLGFREDVQAEELAPALKEGRILDLMRALPVKAGDVIAVPAGCAHAIGAGIFLFEVQQPSDLTYRLYDYDRSGPDGQKRQLHVREGLEAIRLDIRPEKGRPELLDEQGASRRWQLCDMGIFSIERWDLEGELEVDDRGLFVLQSISGSFQVSSSGQREQVPAAGTALMGATDASFRVSGQARILVAVHRPALPGHE